MDTRPVTPISPTTTIEPGADEKVVTKTTTTTIETKLPGFFGRMARRMQNHPITTAIVGSLGTTAAVAGTINYRRTGSVLPPLMNANDARDVVRALTGQLG